MGNAPMCPPGLKKKYWGEKKRGVQRRKIQGVTQPSLNHGRDKTSKRGIQKDRHCGENVNFREENGKRLGKENYLPHFWLIPTSACFSVFQGAILVFFQKFRIRCFKITRKTQTNYEQTTNQIRNQITRSAQPGEKRKGADT